MIVSFDTIIYMKPPCTITHNILNLTAHISQIIGKYEGIHSPPPAPKLRKQNRIKTICGSLQIEGNSLNLEQITAILENKKVLGPPKEIKEVQNAIKAYSELKNFTFYSIKSFLKAHGILLGGLLSDAGKFRSDNVGIFKGKEVAHVAPKAMLVPELIEKLFDYLKNDKEHHSLIKSCIAHYEIEFIHPFADGNGRMGRIWQSVILSHHHPIFEYLPIESSIKEHQEEYYSALEQADKSGDSSPFVEFILNIILQNLSEFLLTVKEVKFEKEERIEKAKEFFRKKSFSRKEYLILFKDISAPTASRDLIWATESKILVKEGNKNQSRYKFIS